MSFLSLHKQPFSVVLPCYPLQELILVGDQLLFWPLFRISEAVTYKHFNFIVNVTGQNYNVAKCNLGKVNLEAMLVSSFLSYIRGGPMPLGSCLLAVLRKVLLQ